MSVARMIAAASLALAAGLHLSAAGEHAAQGWTHVAAFALAAAAQAAGAVAVFAGARRRVLVAVLAVDVALVGAWLASRTVGLPVLAAQAEPAGALDVLTAMAGAIAAAGLSIELGARRPMLVGGATRRRAANGAIAVLASLVLVGSATSAAGTSHHHGAPRAAGPHESGSRAGHGSAGHHGGGLAEAIARETGGAVHVHGLGGEDLDPGPKDATPARVVRIATGSLPAALVATDDAVWVADRTDGTVSAIDPRTLAVQTIDVGGAPAALAFAFDMIWVADFARDTVLRIDPRTRAVAGAPVSVEPGPVALEATARGVWVAGVQEGTVQLVAADATRVSAPISVGYGPVALAATSDDLWVLTTLDRAMVPVDLRSQRVGVAIPVDAGASDLTIAFGRLWVASASTGMVSPHDPVTGRRAGRALALDDRTDAGEGPTSLASGDGRLWVANNHDKTARAIDPGSFALTAPETFGSRLGTGPIPVRATFAFGDLWVTDFDDGVVVRVEVTP